MAVLLQYAYENGPIELYSIWTNPINDTLELIEQIADCDVIGFNLAFDWFHLVKLHTTWTLAKKKFGGDAYPEEHINAFAYLEKEARDGLCLKPKRSLDLMLHARKTEFQITMERSDIRIRRIPTVLAWSLAKELEKRVELADLLFARQKNKLAPRWAVYDCKKKDGSVDKDFKDVVLKFKASVALKALAIHALKVPPEEVIQFQDIEVDKAYWPVEFGYAPFALAATDEKKFWRVKGYKKRGKHGRAWPAVIEAHINHWLHNNRAREYAGKDVEFTRRLYKYFNSPEPGDDDSELATMVAAVRWRGYRVDLGGISSLKEEAEKTIRETPQAPSVVKRWLGELMSDDERAVFTSTGKIVLEGIANQHQQKCPFGPCEECNNTGRMPKHPAADRAAAVLKARGSKKEIELYDKLLMAGRFHASFKVIGTLSSRMSGDNQLNPQGIKKTKDVRSKFPLAWAKTNLYGGDFSGFEVVLADAAYGDLVLRKDLQTCERCRDIQVIQVEGNPLAREFLDSQAFLRYVSWNLKDEEKKIISAGKKGETYTPRTREQIESGRVKMFACPRCGDKKTMKIHALFGVNVYPEMTYDEIKATDGTDDDKYTRCKSAVFAMLYGGEGPTLQSRLGVPIEVADAAYERFTGKYVGVGAARNKVKEAFCSIKQAGGIGSKIVYQEPEEYIESLTGFRRYFTLENAVVKTLFELASDPPEEWKKVKVKVWRRDREQSASGALQSALYGCTFGMQAANMRAAANHVIQSSGAQITKKLQRNIWDLQPIGVNPWVVQPMNVHDQVLTPTDPRYADQLNKVVYETVESFRDRVPLIELEWKQMKDWSSK